jgi:hypothetical protein
MCFINHTRKKVLTFVSQSSDSNHIYANIITDEEVDNDSQAVLDMH